jgi:hypothetical protein
MVSIRPGLAPVSIALVHWPCWNQHGDVVCTNITNFDIHDIARLSRSYGIHRYFIVNKVREQLMFVSRVLDHWRVGEGSEHNPMRRGAIEMIQTAETLEEAIKKHPKKPLIIATSARDTEPTKAPRISFRGLRERIWHNPDEPVLVVFGTGWGLTSEAMDLCDFLLEPVKGASADDYRHLSVRSAASIILDRLLGEW